MRLILRFCAAFVVLSWPLHLRAQQAPIFEQAPAVAYETYNGVNGDVFVEYFESLVDKYHGTDVAGWGIYRENPTVWYRVTPLPDRMQSLIAVSQARNAGAQEFTDHQRALWNSAWGTRHVALYNAAPNMSVVPTDFSVSDITQLPYNRVIVYHLKWDQAAAFRTALRARSALDREAGIENFVLTAWNGGLGTEAPTIMLRISAESQEADLGANREARRMARESYRDEWNRLTGIMNAAAVHIERHDQRRIAELSHVPGS